MPRIQADTIQEHKRVVRRRALEAARDLFRVQGYQQTTLGDVAAAAGVGRSTLYQYFTDKEDLLATLVEDSFPGVIDDLLAGMPPLLSHQERLGELAVRMMEFVATDDNLGTLLMREVPKLSPAAQARVMAAHGRLVEEMARVYEGGVLAGELREMPPDLVHRYVHDLVMSSAKALLASAEPKQHLHEVADTLAGFLLRGLGV